MRAVFTRPRWETPEPPGVTGTYGDRIIRWMKRERGITFGAWQAYVTRRVFRHDRNGDLIHRIALFSTGRQNGKSVIVRGFFDWMLDEGRCLPPFQGWTEMLTAAHDAKQARVIYRGVFDDITSIPRLSKGTPRTDHESGHTPPIIRTTRQQGIEAPGLLFDTVTSEPGSTRGKSAGAIAWDEVLTQKDWDMWEALAPTQSAQRSPIMLLTSTAGHVDSVILRAFYDRLVRMASGDEEPDPLFYGAWWQSTDADAGLDWDQIRLANPALGDGRLTQAAIRLDHSMMPPDGWRRERLNHFVDVKVAGAFQPGVWAACRLPDPLDGVTGPFALGIDVQPGWERATITAAGRRPDGRIGVVVYRDLRATEGAPITADGIIDHVRRFPDPVRTVAYDSVSGGAAAFQREGEISTLTWDGLRPGAMVDACMDVTEMILSGKLAIDDPLLDAQIAWTARRNVGTEGAYRFSRTHSPGPIDGIIAMALAAHAIAYRQRVPGIYV